MPHVFNGMAQKKPPLQGEELFFKMKRSSQVVFAYQEEVAVFYQGGKYGLMDREGNILHPATLEEIQPFEGEYARASIVEKIKTPTAINHSDSRYEKQEGYLNRKGEWVIGPKAYERLSYFEEGYFYTVLENTQNPNWAGK